MTQPDNQDQEPLADLIAIERHLDALNRDLQAVNEALDRLLSDALGRQYAEDLTTRGLRGVGHGLATAAGNLASLSAHMIRRCDELDSA